MQNKNAQNLLTTELGNLNQAELAQLLQANVKTPKIAGAKQAKYNLEAFNTYYSDNATEIGKKQRIKIRRTKAQLLQTIINAHASQEKGAIKAANSAFTDFFTKLWLNPAKTVENIAGSNADPDTKALTKLALHCLNSK
jgi:hypothetical protein